MVDLLCFDGLRHLSGWVDRVLDGELGKRKAVCNGVIAGMWCVFCVEGVDGVDVNGLQSCPRRNMLALFKSLKKSGFRCCQTRHFLIILIRVIFPSHVVANDNLI